ncbi:SUF system Fe-S cluster assembly regulator [Legionella sp. W05-934-2]|jgi:FeS assembly SUF system regulator|uniref:SUF system Fe-S cluster assembly regulator n=1 Tax=Legionella sp. W05-934-2 TaxID=1198649 RepID=UPI00346229B3
MLRISKLADYGTVVMVYLANNQQQLLNARAISEATKLAVPTVSKILKLLATAGLLRSERGVAGGYQLIRAANEISIADIIYAVEEQRGLTSCSVSHGDCAIEPYCVIQGNWRLISRAIETALEGVTLAELAKPGLRTIQVDGIRRIVSGEYSG